MPQRRSRLSTTLPVDSRVAAATRLRSSRQSTGATAEHVRDRRQVRITVSDHGPGIPAKDLPHIFDPFYRGGDALEQQIHGNGLGLSLVKKIVAAHGGQVTVVTRPGAGSAFTITLPAAEAESKDVSARVRAAVHP
jgi:signal transduction histidine kinase